MAKKSEASSSFTNILSEIRAGRYAPVYLLQGEEPYFIDTLAAALTERVVPDEAARDFDMQVYYGAEANTRDVSAAAREFPVMGDKRLVLFKEVQAMRDGRGALASLAPIAAAPAPGTVLVITFKAEPLKASHEFVKAMKRGGGVVFTSSKLREWELNTFISDLCKEARVGIDRKAIELLKEFVGSDLSRLKGDIDKLIVAGGGQTITPEMIERNIGISKDFNNFELVKAISTRNYSRAVQIVDYFERNPKTNPAVMTIAILYRFFSHLMLAHYAPDKSERGLMAQLSYSSPYQLTDIKAAMSRFSAGSVLRIIHVLRLLDCKTKGIGSLLNEYALLKQFIYQVFTL